MRSFSNKPSGCNSQCFSLIYALGKVVEADLPGVGRLTFVYLTDPEGNILEIQNWS